MTHCYSLDKMDLTPPSIAIPTHDPAYRLCWPGERIAEQGAQEWRDPVRMWMDIPGGWVYYPGHLTVWIRAKIVRVPRYHIPFAPL